MNGDKTMKTLTKVTCLAVGLLALSAAVLLGPALSGSTQSPRSAQSRPAQPSRPASTPCPSCSTPAPTPTPSCTCTPTPTPTPSPNIPLNDLGGATYKRAGETFGLRGGLYKGSNQRPAHHDMVGLAIAAAQTPRGPDGGPPRTPAGEDG